MKRKRYNSLFIKTHLKVEENVKILKNYRHGTSRKIAKEIESKGFLLGARNGIYFAPPKHAFSDIYGGGVVIVADIIYNKSITMDDIRKSIVPLLRSKNKKVTEPFVNKELLKMGYDLVIGHNEVVVLNPKNIKIKSIEKT
jgi:hypothetical protein